MSGRFHRLTTKEEGPRWLRATKWAFGSVLAFLAFLTGTVYVLLGGAPWPMAPGVHPHDTIDGSSFVLPFTVTNRSALFDMSAVRFICGVDLVYAEDSSAQKIVVRDTAFVAGTYSIPALKMINLPCDGSQLLRVRDDGSLSLFGSSTILESKNKVAFKEPWRIIKMCVWIGGDYRIWFIPWRFTSPIYQWPATPKLRQWIEGPIARAPPKEEQMPGFFPDALQCSEARRYPYGLTVGPGPQLFVVEPPAWYEWLWRTFTQELLG